MKIRLVLTLLAAMCICTSASASIFVTVDRDGILNGIPGEISFWGSHAAAQTAFPSAGIPDAPEGAANENRYHS